MQVLVAVVESGSFTSAAAKLDLPKSSVSRRVTALEERLGIRLLQRTTRSVRLTTAGEVYFETATRLLRELEELETQQGGILEGDKRRQDGHRGLMPALWSPGQVLWWILESPWQPSAPAIRGAGRPRCWEPGVLAM